MDIKVTKRNGKKEPVMLDKIMDRITQQTYGLDLKWIRPFDVAQKVIEGITNDIETRILDQLAMETSASLTTKHPDYATLASRIAITSLHKETKKSFSETMKDLYNYIDPKTKKHSPVVSESFYNIVKKYADQLDSAIVHTRDHNFDYFGFKVLEKSYLLKINAKIAERPQYMYMRTAIEIWKENIEKVIETYNLMSENYYTHATPTLFNSGTTRPQLSSCFLLSADDSIEGIFDNLKECGQISKNAGGIGIDFSKIRAKGSYIAGTNGTSNGIIPFLKIYNETARAVDQGGNKRRGSISIYLEPWHGDIFDFLDLRKNQGKEEMRARDLFLAIWMNDLFMERVSLDEEWTLMCPNECPGLTEVYGDEFRSLYLKYEGEKKGKKLVKARELWNKILESQIETGTPYILYKDAINERSNQSNIGVVRSSNLCGEISEVTGYTKIQPEILKNKELLDKLNLGEFWGKEKVNETAVCNLASIALPRFVNKNKTYNYNKLFEVAYKATINLNRVIDTNFYPSPAAKFSNFCHRPIGLGVQGLADVFFTMGIPYDSDEAKSLNKQIFETIYYAAIKASCDLAKEEGPYASYEGSPISQGKLQFDLWGVEPSDRWDWKKLKEDIAKFGVRNSLTTCVMPTASCVISSTKIQTIEGVKSYQEIMSENGIDWESIEKTNDQRWIQFKNPLHVKTRFGIRHSDKIFYNGHVETLKIEMEDGIIFTCSNNHKFLVNRDSEEVWVRADELIKDDGIVVFELITKEIRIKNITESGLKPTWDIEVNGVHEYTMENGCVSHNTSSILGNEASYEAQTSNMYLRRVLSGEFIMVNRYLVRDLIKNNLWNDSMRNKIVGNNGSVLNIPEIPDTLKEIYKTVWEVKQKDVIDMAADRGAFIDQTQSMNIFMDPVNFAKLTNMHFYGWGRRPILIDGNGEPIIPNNENIQVISDKDGVAKFYRDKRVSLKTGIYYLRIKSAADAVKFTVTKDESQTKNAEDINCSLDNPEDCIACSA